jgi:hypothetical protein
LDGGEKYKFAIADGEPLPKNCGLSKL